MLVAPSEPADALSVQAVVRRPSAAVLTVRLTAPRGVTVLLGPSGAGKSTTLDLIAGHLVPEQGLVTLGARTLLERQPGQLARVNEPPQTRRIGYVFQSQALFPHLSVHHNLAFGLAGRPRDERERRVSELAEQLALSPFLQRRPGELSGGQRQRVALARALAPAPQALLLDEPLSAVDLPQRRELLARLRELLLTLAIPVLYVTHSEEEVLFWGGPVIELRSVPDLREPAIETVARA